MATPLSADRFIAALRAEGVKVTERPGWRTYNRNHKGPWGGVNGVVIHHTAGSNSLNVCINGVAGLPGPLCHTHLAKNGTATLVGYGRTNHAGTFAANAHNAVVHESATHPRPDAAEPIDGNAHYYGIEIENLGNGKDPYPDVQYDQAVRWAAAICRAHGWSANSVIGHKEGTRRKIDPSFSMVTFRTDVDTRLKHPAGWSPGTTTPEEDDMPTAAEIADAVVNKLIAGGGVLENSDLHRIWYADKIPAARPPYNNPDYYGPDGKTVVNDTWTAKYAVQTTVEGVRETLARVRNLEGAVGAVNLSDADIATLASAVASNPALAEQIAEKVAVKLAERLAE
ncbi:N-acetylmuramoyl-L-alanine amidase [Streptomyces tuirus]|uniref:N-acetylmuramoyl-L-alanine amidase n=1 Tax=Streptomyces tuirus TaxID=68278 RepID=A0A941F7W3_9ACTN|nr:N-acetylmuramoyl-L-alanine amidase [Streptomyces tuirus]